MAPVIRPWTAPGLTLGGLLLALRRLLPVWFVAIDLASVPWFIATTPGSDAVVYVRGAAAFLAGRDPWSATVSIAGAEYHFSGLPPTVVVFIPFALLPEILAGVILTLGGVGSAVLIIRRLRLPVWYLAFPPILAAVWTGNPQLPLMALLLCGGGALAPAIKVFAVAPLFGERRWRSLFLCGLIFGATTIAVSGLWAQFFGEWSAIAARQMAETQGGLSAWGQPLPFLVATCLALLVLALLDQRAAGWLAVPALWPGSQLSYATMTLPLATTPLVAAMAYPLPGLPAVVAIGYACVVAYHRLSTTMSDRVLDR